MGILTLRVKRKYWLQIQDGSKPEEFRLVTDYWSKRLVGKTFDAIHVINGYPGPAEAPGKTLIRPWRGFSIGTIQHPHFGPGTHEVFKIVVNV